LGFISVDGKIHQVSNRDSGTVVTMDTAWQGTGTTTSDWRWGRYQYDLADDIYQVKNIYYGSTKTWTMEPCSWATFQHAIQSASRFSKQGELYCIANGALNIWPTPTEEDFVTIAGYRRPEQITTASDVVDVDPIHVELLHRAIDVRVCMYFNETEGGMTLEQAERNFTKQLAANTPMDRRGQIRTAPLSVHRRRGRGVKSITDTTNVTLT
jgi:hypothetical protein